MRGPSPLAKRLELLLAAVSALALLSMIILSDMLSFEHSTRPRWPTWTSHDTRYSTADAGTATWQADVEDAGEIRLKPREKADASISLAANGRKPSGLGASGDERPCPSVYIYNASQLDADKLFLKGFGPQLGDVPWLLDSEQHGTGAVVLARLLRSARCTLVSEEHAAQAQVFIVPLTFPPARMPTPEEVNKVWDFMPPASAEQLRGTCIRFATEDWKSVLQHWTPENAARHVFLPLDYFDFYGFCSGAENAFSVLLESHRANAELVALTPKITTGIALSTHAGGIGAAGRQRLLTAPLVSSVHLRPGDERPWERPRPRPYLMSYGGSTEGQPRATALRQLLVRRCREYGNSTCRLVTRYQMAQASSLIEAFQAKLDSVFCLEPPGFGEHRKSQADALTLGCIPVMFAPKVDEGIWPLHWGRWRHDSRVLLDMEEVLRTQSEPRKARDTLRSRLGVHTRARGNSPRVSSMLLSAAECC